MAATSISLLAGLLALADAHSSAAVSADTMSCSCVPGSRPAESYHIHVMFFTPDNPAGVPPDDPAGNNPNNMKNAVILRTAFMEHFNISDCPPTGPGQDPTVLCAFEVDPATGAQSFPSKQPFVTPEFAFFVPVGRYTEAVGWMMLNRGVFDVFVHPNTCGWDCAVQDHLLSSLWMGTPWKVKFQLPSGQQVTPTNQLGVDAAAPRPPQPASNPPLAVATAATASAAVAAARAPTVRSPLVEEAWRARNEARSA